jgi:hypothetical protein
MDKNDINEGGGIRHGTLTEGEGTVKLTSSLRSIIISIKMGSTKLARTRMSTAQPYPSVRVLFSG